MLRAPVLCFTIVAAFQLHLTAAEPPAVLPALPVLAVLPVLNEEVVVSTATLALARTLGMNPERDRARFLSELTRLLYTPPAGRNPEIDSQLRAGARPPRPTERSPSTLTVPVPLTAAVWSKAVFRREVPADELLSAILADRKAALLGHGLAALDDETLEYFSREPLVLQRLYESAAPAFAAFGGSVRVRGNRLAPVGGASAEALWATLLGRPIDRPDQCLQALFEEHDGRHAYLYDTIAGLDEPRARFVLGLWMPDDRARALRFQALGTLLLGAYPEWRLEALPFSRPLSDLGMLVFRTRVSPDGAPAPPSARALWAAALEGDDSRDVPAAVDRSSATASIDAAWLAETVIGGDMFWRGDRLDQFAFGQRLFERTTPSERRPGAAEPPEVAGAIDAIRAFRGQRMLMLTLERMGLASPAVYAAAARTGGRIADLGGGRAFWTLAQMQGALAVLARLRRSESIDLATAETLTTSLVSLPLEEGQYQGAVAAWFVRDLWPRLPRGEPAAAERGAASWTRDVELTTALAGPAPANGGPRLEWEGHEYRVDLAFAERRRLRLVRERQRSYPIDLTLSLAAVLDRLKSLRAPEEIGATERALESVARDFVAELGRPAPDVTAPGVAAARAAGVVIAGLLDDLGRARRARDVGRAAKSSAPLAALVDIVLGETLLSFAYALDLGDPAGTALLTRNVALRHDFGLGRRDQPFRSRLVWAVPRQDFLPGVPWHIVGSALGLDIALSPLGLRRITADRLGAVPSLPSNERHAFAVGVALMDPARLSDPDRAQLAEAVARGHQRAASLVEQRDAAGEVSDLLGLDGRRRRELEWTLAHGSVADAERFFSMAELLVLGGGAPAVDLNAWGTSGLQADGCACTRWMLPNRWRLFSGRPQLGLMAAVFPDLNLRVALVLGELGVPALLTRAVLAPATLEFVEGVTLTDANDWTSLVAAARLVSRERIEDYVAASAVVDGPLVPIEPPGPEEGRAP
jgi:hypothetical protein